MDAPVVNLLDRPVYGVRQADRILDLSAGTTARWVDGYTRAGKNYSPIIREHQTGSELVTWGEFVEVRLLAQFRDADVPMLRLRPTVQRLRQELGTTYPLATAHPWLTVRGREVVRRAQEGLTRELSFTVVRTGQEMIDLDPRVQSFVDSVCWDGDTQLARALKPAPDIPEVVCDPLRQAGEPSIGGIPVDIITEQVRVGEPRESVAETYGLSLEQVAAAERYERQRAHRESGRPAA